MPTPKVLMLRSPGANSDLEAAHAFETVGATVDYHHINALRATPTLLKKYQILCVPGGFSYGDDVGAGKILASQLQNFLGDALREFRDKGKLILGICNGFQVILKAGLLLPPDEDGPLATLARNTSGKYEDRWVNLNVTPHNCVFLKGISNMYLPAAHGEGRFITRKEWILQGLEQAGQAVLKYSGSEFPANPNGSQGNIAGITDATGHVLGLMPHPERHMLGVHHPRWTREGLKAEGDGLQLFRNGVDYFVK
ncbi:phosphoribosylformylglycinamidine synthase subunit PurQ [soil metagenome]